MGIARYRLQFKRPFGTAHGVRDGTDAVFIRLKWQGATGYGEATLPPYLERTAEEIERELRRPGIQVLVSTWLKSFPGPFSDPDPGLSPPARAALVMAVHDVLARSRGCSVAELLGVAGTGKKTPAMATIGLGTLEEIPAKLADLPMAQVLKVKLGGAEDAAILRAVMALDARPLFLDANQGWPSVDQAMRVLEATDVQRIVGIEQPFHKDRMAWSKELAERVGVAVYADERMQNAADVERYAGEYGGVNIKLVKCGGTDRAMEMIDRAQRHDLRIMLGCMSESSLGCSAMAQLRSMADLVDLDGPWLLGNDPFQGLAMGEDGLWIDGPEGQGVALALPIEFDPNGA
ncbi:MAG: hypothetical protein KIT10_02685 [Flavobacteriales bacterium]|nr:hypothetical protein [Flavobacteriales bacterium]